MVDPLFDCVTVSRRDPYRNTVPKLAGHAARMITARERV